MGKKKKSVLTAVQIRSEFLPAAGRCNRHEESLPSTGSAVGRVPPKGKAQAAGSPGMNLGQVQTRQSLHG